MPLTCCFLRTHQESSPNSTSNFVLLIQAMHAVFCLSLQINLQNIMSFKSSNTSTMAWHHPSQPLGYGHGKCQGCFSAHDNPTQCSEHGSGCLSLVPTVCHGTCHNRPYEGEESMCSVANANMCTRKHLWHRNECKQSPRKSPYAFCLLVRKYRITT